MEYLVFENILRCFSILDINSGMLVHQFQKFQIQGILLLIFGLVVQRIFLQDSVSRDNNFSGISDSSSCFILSYC